MSATELEAARFVRAALELIRDAVPGGGALDATVSRWQTDADNIVKGLEKDAPPWTPERPERDLPWSAVLCGDEVLAPNGAWYGVDSWSRTGRQVAVLLKANGSTVKSVRDAGQVVRVRRGPAGQAADMFADAGFSLEVLAA